MEGALDWALPQQGGGRGEGPQVVPRSLTWREGSIPPSPTPPHPTPPYHTHSLQGWMCWDPCLDRREAFPGDG